MMLFIDNFIITIFKNKEYKTKCIYLEKSMTYALILAKNWISPYILKLNRMAVYIT